MSKKVIEQVFCLPIETIEYAETIEIWQSDTLDAEPIEVENEFRTTVAKAIDPEYQKVIDHNKFLEVENARLTKVYQKAVNKTHELNEALRELVADLKADRYNHRLATMEKVNQALQNN